MIFCKLISSFLIRDKCVLLSGGCFGKELLRGNVFPIRKLSSSPELIDVKDEKIPQRKLLKVAILGRPNAGKSTLINRIMDMNLCDVSSKTHTTRFPLRAAFVSGDTQIVFVDTPGLVTKKELHRFSLSQEFIDWKETVFKEVDIVGAVYDAPLIKESIRFHSNLIQSLNEVPESKPVFLILNKIDLISNKVHLLEVANKLIHSKDSQDSNKLRDWKKFSRVFFISALKSDGIKDVVEFLLLKAQPSEWLLEPGKVCDTPLHLLISNLLRAKMFNILPFEVPYKCSYEVEYLEENELGQLNCVALITCRYAKNLHMIVNTRRNLLKKISRELESDLYRILMRVVKLRIVVVTKQKN